MATKAANDTNAMTRNATHSIAIAAIGDLLPQLAPPPSLAAGLAPLEKSKCKT